MCGSLNLEGVSHRIGDPVRVTNTLKRSEGLVRWSGFIRLELEDWWIRKGRAIPLLVHASSFVEQGHIFRVPSGRIDAYGLQQSVFVTHQGQQKQVGWKHTVKILTRAPRSEFERRIHKRWPVVHTLPTFGMHIFNQRDLIKDPKDPQIEMFK